MLHSSRRYSKQTKSIQELVDYKFSFRNELIANWHENTNYCNFFRKEYIQTVWSYQLNDVICTMHPACMHFILWLRLSGEIFQQNARNSLSILVRETSNKCNPCRQAKCSNHINCTKSLGMRKVILITCKYSWTHNLFVMSVGEHQHCSRRHNANGCRRDYIWRH